MVAGPKVFQEKILVLWLGWNPLIVLYKPEFVEVSHEKNIEQQMHCNTIGNEYLNDYNF